MPLRVENGVAFLDGRMAQTDVSSLLLAGEQAIVKGCTTFDLSGVEQVDSSALSLLLAWRRRANAQGAALAFHHLPDNIQSLIALYGVGDLLAA